MSATPAQEWWTAAEIAEAGLTDLPRTQQGVDSHAKRLNWRGQPAFARRRVGRGGGWEYHWHLFPSRAQRQLVAAAEVTIPEAPSLEPDAAWTWYEALPEKVKTKARARLATLARVDAMVAAGQGRFLAVIDAARMAGVSPRSVWSWIEMVEGLAASNRLPYLAPRHRAARRKVRRGECSPEFLDALRSDFLRLSQPSFTSCYRRAVRLAEANGWDTLPERTMRRLYRRHVSRATEVLARKGVEALKRLTPAQQRDKTALRPLEVVNADFHKFDVFVRFPAEAGEAGPSVCRPQMVAFQDVFSGRILSWRVDREPNALAVQLAAGDMVETWGIPEHVLLDNGREFAAKAITGGAPTRYRFKVREDDIPGLFVALGCTVMWATPYSGQSKPIERAFRDLCDSVAKDPRFDGAWTGNRPDAKPEDYGSRAIELEAFLSVLAEGIAEHNTRTGRRSEVAMGRSFAEVFDEGYASAPIRKATKAQRRLWLLGAEGLRADARTGAIAFQGNTYHAPWLIEAAGRRVIVRFDPADLWAGVHVYSAENEYLGHAPCQQKVGFRDSAEARQLARARRAALTAERKAMEAQRRFTAAELGALLDAAAPDAQRPAVEAKVVRPAFGTGRRPAPERDEAFEAEAEVVGQALVADLAARRGAAQAPEEDELVRFRRALDLERRIAGGEAVTADQQRWLGVYRQEPEYQGQRLLWEEYGDAMFG